MDPPVGTLPAGCCLGRAGFALDVLRYVYPAVLFVSYTVASLVAVVTLQTIKAAKEQKERPGAAAATATRCRVSISMIGLVILSYLSQVILLLVRALVLDVPFGPDSAVVGSLSCILMFGILLSGLTGEDPPVWWTHVVIWILALGFEASVLGLQAPLGSRMSAVQAVNVAASGLRICAIIALLGTYAAYRRTSTASAGVSQEQAADEERQGLLAKDGDDAEAQEAGYGATTGNDATTGNGAAKDPDQDSGKGKDKVQKKDSDKKDKAEKKKKVHEFAWRKARREAREALEKRLEEDGNWFTYLRSFDIFWPYIWPAGNRGLQVRIALIGLCMVCSNALHVLIPRQVGIIMDALAGTGSGSGAVVGAVLLQVLIFILLRLAAGECGVDLVKSWLLIPVRLWTTQSMTVASFRHLMHLSADFHDSTPLGDMFNSMFGGSRLSTILENVLFSTGPMFVDMALAFVYLSVILGPYEGLISVASGTMFVWVAAGMVSRRDKAVLKLEELQNEQWHAKCNGLTGWQTVSSFNQVEYECNRFKDAVHAETDLKREVQFGWQLSSALQSLALLSGLAASAALAVFRIRDGRATPGQFAMLLSYWAQMSAPLRYLVDFGKGAREDFIFCERLRRIMSKQPTVQSRPGARPIRFQAGEVEFRNVSFGYDKDKDKKTKDNTKDKDGGDGKPSKPVIQNLSFRVAGGQTVALVGATGAGKSTILKLVNRFYDVTEGAVLIDGQDVRDVDLSSLRDRIGVVPQNAVLFGDTVINNVRYARLTASDEEVEDACKAAAMHDKIVTFDDGYDSYVGERGVKLSGGELQRVAIARAILKRPDIVLLDEATSAVDTDTEQRIQESFARLCEGRTTFIVAHRLSTVKNADRILVLGDGAILEDGTHAELLKLRGKYANLWMKQGFVRPETEEERALGIHNDVVPDPGADDDDEIGEEAATKGKQPADGEERDQMAEGSQQPDAAGKEDQPATVATASGKMDEGDGDSSGE